MLYGDTGPTGEAFAHLLSTSFELMLEYTGEKGLGRFSFLECRLVRELELTADWVGRRYCVRV